MRPPTVGNSSPSGDRRPSGSGSRSRLGSSSQPMLRAPPPWGGGAAPLPPSWRGRSAAAPPPVAACSAPTGGSEGGAGERFSRARDVVDRPARARPPDRRQRGPSALTWIYHAWGAASPRHGLLIAAPVDPSHFAGWNAAVGERQSREAAARHNLVPAACRAGVVVVSVRRRPRLAQQQRGTTAATLVVVAPHSCRAARACSINWKRKCWCRVQSATWDVVRRSGQAAGGGFVWRQGQGDHG